MAVPPWTIELLRRGLSDVARKAGEPETLAKIKTQASEILQDLPDTAARGIQAVLRSAESGKKSMERWSRKQTEMATVMLNASGVLFHDLGTGVPLADAVVDVGLEFLKGDAIRSAGQSDTVSQRLRRQIPESSDYAIAITSNFPAALTAFSLLVQKMPLVIHRNHSVRLPDGTPLPEAFGMLLPVIEEVGAVGQVRAGDFGGREEFCAILADGGQHPVELLELEDRDFRQAVVLPVATLAESGLDSIPSAESMIAQGADFVIFPCDGIAGGPPCGIMVGRREEIEFIKASSAWPSLVAGEATVAMLTVALECAADCQNQIPIRALLDTAEQNLQSRAERLATRFAGCDSIASCQIADDEARLTGDGRWKFPSRQLRLRHASLSSERWAASLRDQSPAVIALSDGDDLRVDLRWIAAADDAKIAAALGANSDLDAPQPQSGTQAH